MTFEFQGAKYRIGFRHDKSRDWDAHREHKVSIERDRSLMESTPLGPAFLYCNDCQIRLSHVPKDERLRSTRCVVLRRDADEWRPIGEAAGRLNVKAGDRFEKEAGRVAALAAALESLPEFFSKNREFRNAAWQSYWNRIQKKQQKVTA